MRIALSLTIGVGLLVWAMVPRTSAQGPQRELPPGPLQEKARKACLGCHTADIIVQQQLNRRVWTREVDKMIRWGAPVAAEDREALIDYLAQHFGPREEEAPTAALPSGAGQEKVRAACLGCHDAAIIAQQQLDRRSWERRLDKMIRWGAPVRARNREVILNYLVKNYSAPQAEKQEKPQ